MHELSSFDLLPLSRTDPCGVIAIAIAVRTMEQAAARQDYKG